MTSQANPVADEAGTQMSILEDGKEKHRRSACSKLLRSLFIVGFILVIFPLLIAIEIIIIFLLSIMLIPLEAVNFLIERLKQLLRNGDAYLKATIAKADIRRQMLIKIFMSLICLCIFYILASKVPKIKHITIYDLSIRHWTHVAFMLHGLYVLSFFLSFLVAKLSPPMVWQYERGINAAQAATEIIDCLVFWLATTLVLKHVPPFKQHHVMGLSTHRWIQVVICILIVIDTIAFFCHFITFLFYKFFKSIDDTFYVKSKKHYYGEEIPDGKMYWVDGLRKNIVFIFGSMVLFISWNSYVRTHLNATPEGKKVLRFVTMAFASLLILAVLWLIKSCIVLTWKANQVYAHLRPRLLENREELYFLGILDRHKFDILSIEGNPPFASKNIKIKIRPLRRKKKQNSPLETEPLDSTKRRRVPSISRNEQQQKDPGDKKQSGMSAASWKPYLESAFITMSDIVAQDERDKEKYLDLMEMARVGDWSVDFLIKFIFKKVVHSISYDRLSQIIRDDLYIWKVEGDVEKEEQEDVEKVIVDGSEILYPSLYDLQQMSQYFLRARSTLSSDKYVPNMLHYLTTSATKRGRSLEEHLKQLLKYKTSESQEVYEWQWFKRLVDTQSKATNESRKSSSKKSNAGTTSSNEINKSCESSSMEVNEPGTSSSNEIKESCDSPSNETKEAQKVEKETLKAWLENARGTCMELANTLSSAEEVVNCLDNIMSGILIGATFIMWLLLTGLATTKILVLIASPLLAVTFIFGDTCKSLFQGIIFAYMCHPFNVGDLVIIDDKMMVVKIMGVWKTIFVEIGRSDEVIYPNSELVNKKVINHKSDFDWNDRLEFSLKSIESQKIEELREAIKKDLSKEEKCSPNHISSEVQVSEEDVKLVVHLKYNTDNQHGMTLYERLQEKHDCRSLFTIMIWNLLKQHKTKKD